MFRRDNGGEAAWFGSAPWQLSDGCTAKLRLGAIRIADLTVGHEADPVQIG
jgi:hypothetical protein